MNHAGFIDFAEASLGNLCPFPAMGKNMFMEQKASTICEGDVTINGVPLPHGVIIELRKLGLPLAWYTHGQLQEAVEACAVDCQLIDDPDGMNLRDQMKLTDDEKRKNTPRSGWNFNPFSRKSHCDELLSERGDDEERLERHCA